MTSITTAPRPRLRGVRPLGLVLAAIAVVGASYLASSFGSRSAQRATAPGPEAGRVQALTPETALAQDAGAADLAQIDTQIGIWGPKSAADARDDISAGNLAILYLGRGRLTGDAADYEKAVFAADRAVAAYPTSTGTRALKATVLQATHDFTGALALATAIVAEDPRNVDALAVVGDAQLELGRLSDAAATYARVGAILPGPALDARLARLAWLRGDPASALTLATHARDEAADSGSSDPSFYEAQLGEIARVTGASDVARSAFEAALKLRAGNQLALVGLARLDAFAGDPGAAIARLRTAAAIAPRPETLGLLSDLLDETGDRTGAKRAADTVRVIEQLGGTSAQLFDRQILGFELDHDGPAATVLAKATAAADIRPDAAGLDLVAWAEYRLGDLEAASAWSGRALASGSVDARILYHAGAIAIARGDVDAGRGLVERALALGAALDPLDRAGAEALRAGS